MECHDRDVAAVMNRDHDPVATASRHPVSDLGHLDGMAMFAVPIREQIHEAFGGHRASFPPRPLRPGLVARRISRRVNLVGLVGVPGHRVLNPRKVFRPYDPVGRRADRRGRAVMRRRMAPGVRAPRPARAPQDSISQRRLPGVENQGPKRGARPLDAQRRSGGRAATRAGGGTRPPSASRPRESSHVRFRRTGSCGIPVMHRGFALGARGGLREGAHRSGDSGE